LQTAVIVTKFAKAAAVAGRPETAARLLACSVALHEELGATLGAWLAGIHEETLAVTVRSSTTTRSRRHASKAAG
jgi:hypothetical protein